jgi:hypothetical protein
MSPQGRCLATAPPPFRVGIPIEKTSTTTHDYPGPIVRQHCQGVLLLMLVSVYRDNTRKNDCSPQYLIFSGYLCVSRTSVHNNKFKPEQLLTFRFSGPNSTRWERTFFQSFADCPCTPPRRLCQTPSQTRSGGLAQRVVRGGDDFQRECQIIIHIVQRLNQNVGIYQR